MRERTCAIIVIGNEILSGKVQDTNAYFATRELRKLGVTLKRIAIVPDELDAIGEEVAYCAERFEFVLTSGGVGPTHDDITMEGVARAFKRKLVIHPELERLIHQHFADRVNAAGLKMAEVPDGAVLNAAHDLRFPTVQLENVYILPGIPQIFEPKLLALAGRVARIGAHALLCSNGVGAGFRKRGGSTASRAGSATAERRGRLEGSRGRRGDIGRKCIVYSREARLRDSRRNRRWRRLSADWRQHPGFRYDLAKLPRRRLRRHARYDQGRPAGAFLGPHRDCTFGVAIGFGYIAGQRSVHDEWREQLAHTRPADE